LSGTKLINTVKLKSQVDHYQIGNIDLSNVKYQLMQRKMSKIESKK